jgi:hypothetical protein
MRSLLAFWLGGAAAGPLVADDPARRVFRLLQSGAGDVFRGTGDAATGVFRGSGGSATEVFR